MHDHYPWARVEYRRGMAGNGKVMARSIWTGAISFGLVNVPVRLYSAIQQKDVRFHEFDERSGKRIRHKRVTEGSNREVDYDKVAKGYEVSKGRYVVLE